MVTQKQRIALYDRYEAVREKQKAIEEERIALTKREKELYDELRKLEMESISMYFAICNNCTYRYEA